MTKAGPIIPVRVLSASDLRANGGSYVVEARAAIRVEGFTPATTGGRAIQGGQALPVYIITDSDLRTNGGSYALDGDPDETPVINTVAGDYDVEAGAAIPIYVVSPSGWPSVTPTQTYIIYDRFTDTDAAPITTPRLPTVGREDYVNTGSFSVGSGVLSVTGTPVGAGTGFVARNTDATSITRTLGRAFFFSSLNRTTLASQTYFGLIQSTNLASTAFDHAFRYNSNTSVIMVREGGGGTVGRAITLSSSTVQHWMCIIMRTEGALLLDKEGGTISGTYNLRWVQDFATITPINVMVNTPASGNVTMEWDDLIALDTSAPYTSQFGAATYYDATPTSGDTGTGTANGFVEFEWTVAAAETLDISYRRTDDNNRWITRCTQAASTVEVIERNAGVNTVRGSAAGVTFTAGSRYRIITTVGTESTATSIRTYTHLTTSGAAIERANYTTATFNQSATGVACSGFATGINFAMWPSTLNLTVTL